MVLEVQLMKITGAPGLYIQSSVINNSWVNSVLSFLSLAVWNNERQNRTERKKCPFLSSRHRGQSLLIFRKVLETLICYLDLGFQWCSHTYGVYYWVISYGISLEKAAQSSTYQICDITRRCRKPWLSYNQPMELLNLRLNRRFN